MKIQFSMLILMAMIISGCKLIYVDLFDSNNAKIELFNKIISNPERIESIIINSKFYKEEVSNYFLKNTTAFNDVVKFLEKNKGREISLLYNKKFSITSYPVQGNYKDGEDIYFHEISYIYVSDKSNSVKDMLNVIMISFVLHDSNWFFKNINMWNKEELERLY